MSCSKLTKQFLYSELSKGKKNCQQKWFKNSFKVSLFGLYSDLWENLAQNKGSWCTASHKETRIAEFAHIEECERKLALRKKNRKFYRRIILQMPSLDLQNYMIVAIIFAHDDKYRYKVCDVLIKYVFLNNHSFLLFFLSALSYPPPSPFSLHLS